MTQPNAPAAPWRSWALSDIGIGRATNEDAILLRPDIGLWMVADGAGGHQHGEVASNLLAETLGEVAPASAPNPLPDLVATTRAQVAHAHQALRTRAHAESRDTGAPITIASTIVVLLANGAHYACLWAGDSRLYKLRDGQLTCLTRDHSLVQMMVDEGRLSPEDAEHHPRANVITRAIGADDTDPGLDHLDGQAQPGDRFLLCSDGLNKALPASLIARLAATPDPARALIDAALAHGVRDNVTAIVLAYGPDPTHGT